MIVDERFVTYINSLDTENTSFLEELEKTAKEAYVPIIRREMQSLLKLLLAMNPVACEITTIENYEKRIPIAKENFAKAGRDQMITLLEGDAAEVLKTLQEPYDFIFMDAAKGQYIHFFDDVLRLLAEGGILVSDNVLQDGDIIESHYAVTRRNRTIHKRMREYLYELTHNEQLTTAVLPVGDGVTVSVKKEQLEKE